MTAAAPSPSGQVDVLDLASASGTWAVRSASVTVYYLDLDRSRLLRAPGPGSTRGDFDGQWVPLVSIAGPDFVDQVRVGHRHKYLTDPLGGVYDYRWWVQRTVTSIWPLTDEQANELNPPNAFELLDPANGSPGERDRP